MRLCGKGEAAAVSSQPLALSGQYPQKGCGIEIEIQADSQELPPQYPHCPARGQHAAQEHCEAVEAVANHVARGLAVSDAEDDGSEEGKHRSRAKVVECDGHCFFPIAM